MFALGVSLLSLAAYGVIPCAINPNVWTPYVVWPLLVVGPTLVWLNNRENPSGERCLATGDQ